MLILGDISGISDFVTNVSHVGGGQAKRLRARSFYVQALCDVAAVKVLSALGYRKVDESHLLMAAAGHFLLRVDDGPEFETILKRQVREMNAWLLTELAGEVRLSLAWTSEGATEMEQLRNAQRRLIRVGLRPWAAVATGEGSWDAGRLLLDPLGTPCPLCRQRKGEITEQDEETGEQRLVCRLCERLKTMGAELPRASWLAVTTTGAALAASAASISAFGLTVELRRIMPSPATSTLAVASLDQRIASGTRGPFDGRWLTRTLARHVPSNLEGGRSTLDFRAIADESTGDRKLGVMKADGDGMGEFWTSIIESDRGLADYCRMSKEFDDFSAREINQLLAGANAARQRWSLIYTVFSGGDDLLFVGPWDVILDFAAEVRRRFSARFSEHGLSLSAGVAIVKPGWPVRRMAQLAQELLEDAKTVPAPGAATAKDQIATLGEIWKWGDHAAIIEEGRRWTSWVKADLLERGWLQRIRSFNEAHKAYRGRHDRSLEGDLTSEMMASARLGYLIDRYITASLGGRRRSNPESEALRARLGQLLEEFETAATPKARHLSASLQYAILATRSPEAED